MAFRLDNGPIDATNPDNLSDRVASERETRQKLLNHARIAEVERGVKGLEREMLMLFARADKMLRTCPNDKERRDIGKMLAVEAYRILGGGGQLFIDGQLVCDDRTKEQIQEDEMKRLQGNKIII